MARASNATRTLEPNPTYDCEDKVNEEDNVAYLNKKGEIVFYAHRKNKITCSNFFEILAVSIEGKKLLRKRKSMT
jgi:hypothetical protein